MRQKHQCHYNTGVLGGRGWITQAAHLKRPRRGLFAAGTYGGGPYELRLPIFLQPLGGALKNRSAAPASPPCFRRRRRSAPLLFESTLESETSVFYKTKSPAYFRTLSIFGGRGWITQAAHLKRPRRGLFAAGTYGGGRCCSNPP